MPKITKRRLSDVLTRRLALTEPQFVLETVPGGKLAGSVVSDTFQNWDDMERQQHIWDALDAEFGAEATRLVSVLLAYTQAEWNIDLAEPAPARRARRAQA